MNGIIQFSIGFFVAISAVLADFSNVTHLVAETEELVIGFSSYDPATNNSAYFENFTSTDPICKLLKCVCSEMSFSVCFSLWNVRFYYSRWRNCWIGIGKSIN